MNEVKHVHIGRQQFTVAVDAYGELKDYLSAITAQAGQNGDEVVQEVELRMAELLHERGIDDQKVVVQQDVQFLKEQLGEPQDFKDESDDTNAEPTKDVEGHPRRLYRDTEHGMIAGVASGLANYFGIDPVIVRIIFIGLLFAGGSSILIYLLLWLLVPEAKTTADKLSMQGKAVTVDNLKQAVKDADVPAAARRVSRTVGRIFEETFKLLLIIAGVILISIGLLGAIGAMTAGTYALVSGVRVNDNIIFPFGSHEVAAFVAGMIALLVALFSMVLIGITMLRLRWQLPAWGLAALIGIFLVSASVSSAFAVDVAPHVRDRVNALHHTRSVQVPTFTSVDFEGQNTDFTYVVDTHTYVVYRYIGSLDAAKLKATVTDGKLVIDTKDAGSKSTCNGFCVSNDSDLIAEVHGPPIATITINGQTSDMLQRCKSFTVFRASDAECIGWPPIKPLNEPLPSGN